MKLCASKFNFSFAILGKTAFLYMGKDGWPAGKGAEVYFGKHLVDAAYQRIGQILNGRSFAHRNPSRKVICLARS